MEIAIVYIFAPIENKRLVGAAAWRIGRSGSRLVCSHEITSMTALPSTNGRLYRDSVMAQLQAWPAKKPTMIQKALPPPLLRIDYEDLRIGSATPDTTLHMQKKSI